MVMSDKMMASLKYCLDWLQYARRRIETHSATLRVELSRHSSVPPPLMPSGVLTSQALQQNHFIGMLGSIQAEIVGILREVVDIISKYAVVYIL